MRDRFIGAFTLLEVMVAVAILGIAMTAIFASEGAAIRTGARARHMTTATLLARCKMGELEEHIAVDGMPAVGEDGEDECCEGGEQNGFRCEWNIERVELPDTVDLGGESGDPLGEDGAGGADLETALSGAATGDAIGGYAVQFAWPVLRPAIENQVRRASVEVFWSEGGEERSFTVSQYIVTNPPPAVPGGATPPTPAPPVP